MAFAHVFRQVWCNQTVIAQDARNSVRRKIAGRNDHHNRPPCILHFFLARKDKSIMTIVPSNFINMVLCRDPWHRGSFGPSQVPEVPLPTGRTTSGDYIALVKARRTPPAPQPPVRQTSHTSRHFFPELSHSCSGLFFGSCSPPPLLSEEAEAAIDRPQMVRCLHGEKLLPDVAC